MSDIKVLTVPKWGMSMEEGTLVNWLVKEGDTIAVEDEIAEIESSKIVNTMTSHVTGTIRRLIAEVDQILPVGGLLAVVADDSISDQLLDEFIACYGEGTSSSQSADNDSSSVVSATKAEEPDDDDIPATPGARRLARQLGISLTDCQASDSRGRVSKEDVEAAQAKLTSGQDETPVVSPDSERSITEEIELSPIRQTIAQRLQQAKVEIPHYRLTVDVKIDGLLAWRQKLNQSLTGDKVSINDLLIKACALALMEVPACNVQFDGTLIRTFSQTDISMAVSLESGLITPIVKDASNKSVLQISKETKDLINRAQAGTLQQDEFQGGSFTISNLGMMGIKQFDAIINLPQCAILAVGCGEQRAVVEGDKLGIATMMTLSLSLDHRVIDGVLGARFLKVLVEVIENPERLNTEDESSS